MEDQDKKFNLLKAKGELVLFLFNLQNQIIVTLISAYFVSCFPGMSCRLNFLNIFTVILAIAFLIFDIRVGFSFVAFKGKPIVVLTNFEKELMKFIILLGFSITIIWLAAFF